MRLGLGDGDGMRIKEVPHTGVAADQDELLEPGAGATGLEQPEHPLDRDVHDRLGRLLAGGQVQHVGHALDGPIDGIPVLDGA